MLAIEVLFLIKRRWSEVGRGRSSSSSRHTLCSALLTSLNHPAHNHGYYTQHTARSVHSITPQRAYRPAIFPKETTIPLISMISTRCCDIRSTGTLLFRNHERRKGFFGWWSLRYSSGKRTSDQVVRHPCGIGSCGSFAQSSVVPMCVTGVSVEGEKGEFVVVNRRFGREGKVPVPSVGGFPDQTWGKELVC